MFSFFSYEYFGYIPGAKKDIFEIIDSAKIDELKKEKLTPRDLKYTNSKRRTPLTAAIETNNLEMVKVLISKGPDWKIDLIRKKKTSIL